MKTRTTFLIAVILCFATAAFAQNTKASFEKAYLTRAADGIPCVQLNWQNGSENIAYFLVQKSEDGNVFKTVAMVFTSENPELTAYAYKDRTASADGKAVFYRIASVSEYKELTYLPVQKVEISVADAASILSPSTVASTAK